MTPLKAPLCSVGIKRSEKGAQCILGLVVPAQKRGGAWCCVALWELKSTCPVGAQRRHNVNCPSESPVTD